ncbi:GGDEF domain-containing protein [Moritella sp. 24]|uniref:tetratricopeptide repeat-containing diguanylate cyclase n=1 Tax=Moritella sp. 24 TaxID=2746230 RepID=UPI001BA993E3|nr:tetratricopeptide repeat-containing diguanylate cyclase [Moritella sp. 24]QUM76832.1 GGDEF domain-containing protein [Moritella sp. 24]
MNVVKPLMMISIVSVTLLLFILRPFGLLDDKSPLSSTKTTAFVPDELMAALPFGQDILAARDLSRFDGDEALLRLSLLEQRGTFEEHDLYKAYYYMIMNNIMLRLGRIDDATGYTKRLFTFAEDNNITWLRASALAELAIERTKRGDFVTANQYLTEGVTIAKAINFDSLLIKLYNTLGVINNISGDYGQAQQFFHKGLKLVENYPEHLYYSKIISNLSLIYINLEEWSKALEYIEKAKVIYHTGARLEPGILAILLVNESNMYFHLNDTENARSAYEDAKVYVKQDASARLKAILFKTHADVLYLEKNFAMSLDVSHQCLNSKDINEFPLQKALCYTSKARSEVALGNNIIAVNDLNIAIDYYENLSSRSGITLSNQLLSEAYEKLGYEAEALKYFKLYYQENKKALFDRRQSEIYQLEESFNAETNRHALALLNTQHELKKLALERQTLGSRVIFGMSLCAVFGLGYVIKKNLDIEKKNELLQCSNTDLVELSTRDALTGLYNRRHFEYYLQILNQDKSLYTDRCFTLAILDLDHFKVINDNHGHDVGDEVLIEVSKRFQQSLHSSDLIIRWGGEEFVCLIEQKNNVDSLDRLNRLCHKIRNKPMKTDCKDIHVTLSVGAVVDISAAELAANSSDLIKLADEYLYKAKQTGRNQIIAESRNCKPVLDNVVEINC